MSDRTRAGLIAGGVFALAVLLFFGYQRRATLRAAAPSWLNVEQPPEGIAGKPSALTPAQTWAVNRPTPMAQSSRCCSAGSRIHRTYPAQLCDHPDSLLRAQIGFSGDVD